MDNLVDVIANKEEAAEEGANVLFGYLGVVIPDLIQNGLIRV